MSSAKVKTALTLIVLFLGCLTLPGQTIVENTQETLTRLIAVLSSEASRQDKAQACLQLAAIGNKEAVAPLAALLPDEKLSHMARYALETIPDAGADAALREALDKTQGVTRVGIIASIGVRRDAQAVPVLSGLLNAPDTAAAEAAARALGRIGTPAAAKALTRALGGTSAAGLGLYEGLLLCAETMSARNQQREAAAIYDRLLRAKGPGHVRAGALRGAILSRHDGLALLSRHLRSGDEVLFTAAVQTAMEMPGPGPAQALTAELNRLAPDRQYLVIQALGKGGDSQAVTPLIGLARRADPAIRVESVRALTELGDAKAVPVLAELLADGDNAVAQAARDALAAFPGPEADEVVLTLLESGEAGTKLTALELVDRRKIKESIPTLLATTRDSDPALRRAAVRAVGRIGGEPEFPRLLDLFKDAKAPPDQEAAEAALVEMIAKADDREPYTRELTELLGASPPEKKSGIIRVLGLSGGSNALAGVRLGLKDSDAEVRAAAVRSLCSWRTTDAAPDLLLLARTAPEQRDRTLSVRAFLGLAAHPDLSADQRLSMCRQAEEVLTGSDDRKLLLSVLGRVPTAEALSLVTARLDDPETKDEACAAAVAIGEAIVEKNPVEVRKAMEKVVKLSENRNLLNRANALLNKTGGKVSP
jgi:HEAT repeat protein